MRTLSKHFLISLALALAGATAASATWDEIPCGAAHQKDWQAFAEKMRTATPDSPIYVPHPFPKTSQEAFDDFVFYHRRAFADIPLDKLRPDEHRFFTDLDKNQLNIQAVKVANWTPLRCGAKRERTFYFLFRVFERTSGTEIVRVAVSSDGLPATLMFRSLKPELAQYPRAFPSLAAATGTARSATGASSLADAQYVATWGTLDCNPLIPCVALRGGSDVFVVKSSQVFRLELGNGVISFKNDLRPGTSRRQDVLSKYRKLGERLISLGGNAFVPAVLVHSQGAVSRP